MASADLLQVWLVGKTAEDVTEPKIERYIRFRTVVKICLIQNEKCMFAFQKKRLTYWKNLLKTREC